MSKISLMVLLLMVTVTSSWWWRRKKNMSWPGRASPKRTQGSQGKATMVRSASIENEKYKVLLKDLDKPSAAAGKKLLWDATKIVGEYLCTIGAKECEAIKEYLEEADMEEKEIDDQETKDALISDANKIMKTNLESFMMLDTLRDVLINLICSNEPELCPFWRSYEKDAEAWEDSVKPGDHNKYRF